MEPIGSIFMVKLCDLCSALVLKRSTIRSQTIPNIKTIKYTDNTVKERKRKKTKNKKQLTERSLPWQMEIRWLDLGVLSFNMRMIHAILASQSCSLAFPMLRIIIVIINIKQTTISITKHTHTYINHIQYGCITIRCYSCFRFIFLVNQVSVAILNRSTSSSTPSKSTKRLNVFLFVYLKFWTKTTSINK